MLNLVGKGLTTLKQKDVGSGVNIKHLDVSFNQLHSGLQFKAFINLQTLIIDDNIFNTLVDFPILKYLQTFSANKNNFNDLGGFLSQAYDKFGDLKNLSLLKNPINPFFEGQIKYNIYRDAILDRFNTLVTLDGCAVKIMKKQIATKQKQQQQQYQKLKGVAVYDEKYASQQVKSVKTRSQGNRFLKNNHL